GGFFGAILGILFTFFTSRLGGWYTIQSWDITGACL
ncbi:unnamed protein product, partial [marine sediment metagenome]